MRVIVGLSLLTAITLQSGICGWVGCGGVTMPSPPQEKSTGVGRGELIGCGNCG